jgi:hypothetical protein
MGMFSNVYLNDHRMTFAQAYDEDGPDRISWEITTTAAGEHRPGTLFLGQGNIALQQCPSFDGPDNWSNAPYTGYNYNTSYIGHGTAEVITEPARMADVKSPAACALFGDGQWAGGANKLMRAPYDDVANGGDAMPSSMRAAGTQGYRHQQRTNYLSVDGHGVTFDQRFDGGQTLAPDTGFLSEQNELYDLK